MRLSAPQAVEVALAHARTLPGVLDCVAVGSHESTTSLRWANNTMTSNGFGWSNSLSVVAYVKVNGGVASGTVSDSDSDFGIVFARSVVERAVAAARDAEPARNPVELPGNLHVGNWDAQPYVTDVDALANVTATLGAVLLRGGKEERNHSGYAEHERCSTWVGSLSGIRLRDDEQDGRLEMTCRADGGSRSAWEGKHSRSLIDVDVHALDDALIRQLSWQRNRRELSPGRYRTVLPPGPVGDLMATYDANLGGREAVEGSGPFARAGGSTRIGERVAGHRSYDLYSDPAHTGIEVSPYVVDLWDSATSSVFDTGRRAVRTDWVKDGVLTALCTSGDVAAATGLAFAPNVANLILDVEGGHGDTDEVIARTEHGLLINTLWYIRDVDDATMTVTGTTRDGVYEIRDGEVIGAVTNFRFNESPLSVLARVQDAGAPVLCQTRENAETISDFLMPTLVVEDFNMSSVSEAY